jgi:2'-5' RNA ligase
MEIRSFLAFELPPDIKKRVLAVSAELRRSPLDVKCVKGDNIHLTVVFLGNVDSDDIKALGEAVEEVCRGYGPFSISLKGIGCFPDRRNPRVLWLGLEGDLERLSCFRDDLQGHLRPFHIKEEKRPFSPHLTLGRFRRHNRRDALLDEWMSEHADVESPACGLGPMILFRSDLNPGGALYTKMASWPLSGNR